MKHFFFFALLAIIIFSCQKEIGFGDGNSGTTASPTNSKKCTGCSYLPVCDSTQLTYIDSTAAGVDTISSTLKITGDTTISGTKYNRVSAFAVFNQGLVYNCGNGNYQVYEAVPDLGINVDSLFQSIGLPAGSITIPSHIKTTILKSSLAAGATWTDTVFTSTAIPLFTIVGKLDYKIEEKGIQRMVYGKSYSNVIHVSSKLNVVIPLITFPIDVSIDYYFAEGVGIIESKTTNSGIIQSLTRLYSYKI